VIQVPLTFSCSGCGKPIVVKFLEPGEAAKCRECGKETMVPGDAEPTDATADFLKGEPAPLGKQDELETTNLSCPRCNETVGRAEGTCPYCNFDYTSISLYNPKHFFWQAPTLSFLVPAYEGAMNWGRTGDKVRQQLWLWGSILFAVLLFTSLGFIPDEMARIATPIAYVVNLVVAGALYSRQHSLYDGYTRMGAKTASVVKGSLIGMGISVLVLIPVLAMYVFVIPDPYMEAESLIEEGNYTEAAMVMEKIVEDNPRDTDSLNRLGLVYIQVENWMAAEEVFQEYILKRPKDPEGYALLSYVLEGQGRFEEANRQYE
jgi:hypothetical protein